MIPSEANLSPAATDILKKMVTDAEKRLGRNGADEIKNHPFFDGVDWTSFRNQKAPYIPQVTSEISTENFDEFKEEEPFFAPDKNARRHANGRKVDMNFIGYTFKADVENERSMLVNVLKELDSLTETQTAPVVRNKPVHPTKETSSKLSK